MALTKVEKKVKKGKKQQPRKSEIKSKKNGRQQPKPKTPAHKKVAVKKSFKPAPIESEMEAGLDEDFLDNDIETDEIDDTDYEEDELNG